MNEKNLITYYNKFNENKRLSSRHGIVEFTTTMHYLKKYLKNNSTILDVGAGTGKYSYELEKLGHKVIALELVKHNLMTLRKNYPDITSFQGNALDLSKFNDNSFDAILLFGPMYHLINYEEKLQALNEAKRKVKPNGLIFISYYMNDYAIIKHGFMEQYITKSLDIIDKNFMINPNQDDLYSYVRLKDINKLKKNSNLKRIKILAQDGASDYIRTYLNKLTDEEFNLFLKYHLSICENKYLIGASSHVLDILKNTNTF